MLSLDDIEFNGSYFKTTLLTLCILGFFLVISFTLVYFNFGLPSYKQLKVYEPPVLTQVYDTHGKPIYSFAQQKRKFVPIKYIPKVVQYAFIAAEDQRFYKHFGIDVRAIIRAGLIDVVYYFQGKRLIGASTITQQVAKNFLLSNQYTFGRKIKEALLALKIDTYLSKNRILELYLNQIYLGFGNYGIDSAATYYFHKPLDQLDIAESAYLAALPKGPALYKPYLNDGKMNPRAVQRRNWVIQRMKENGYISQDQYAQAIEEPLVENAKSKGFSHDYASYFLSDVRRKLLADYGYMNLYGGGYSVYTSYHPDIQKQASNAFSKGIVEYDKRHGYRGAWRHIDLKNPNWLQNFKNLVYQESNYNWRIALVYGVTDSQAFLLFQDESRGILSIDGAMWARPYINENRVGGRITSLKRIIHKGDVIFVQNTSSGLQLRQIPKVNGGMIVMDLKSGRVFALVGGWEHMKNTFNRATQAYRQIGSAVKPFLFATALEKGYTPMTFISNEPFVFTSDKSSFIWNPGNYKKRFTGSDSLSYGLIHSKNLLTLHLAYDIGLEDFKKLTLKTGLYSKDYQTNLSMALGSKETTLIRLVAAYSTLITGKKVNPNLIDKIIDKDGNLVYHHQIFKCVECEEGGDKIYALENLQPQVVSSSTAYQISSILQKIPKIGTARSLAGLNFPMGGKTGSTNNFRDAWYVGYTPDIIVGVYIGFDTPSSLGSSKGISEEGAKAALPIFKYFIQEYIKDKKSKPFPIPSSINIFHVNAQNGTWPARGRITNMPLPTGSKPTPYKQNSRDVLYKSPYQPTGLY